MIAIAAASVGTWGKDWATMAVAFIIVETSTFGIGMVYGLAWVAGSMDGYKRVFLGGHAESHA
jgi:hypothetical protein